MTMRLFNTYSRRLEEFHPLDSAGREVKMYTCGPTVYSRAHIGNFRAYVFEDLLQRHLEARGYNVHRVMNITDVDDKTIRSARLAGVRLSEFTEQFKNAFFDDCKTLRIKRANDFPAATDQRYVDKMIAMISHLVSRGLAYQADDKSVYFRIKNFPDYGKLAQFDLTQLRSTGRVKNDEYDKEHVGDFALWKAWDEEDGDVGWESPWGRGRPGWHIECSAMATTLLGSEIDIHCGGVDNIFPHHEAEIAQSEGVTGKRFVRYWLHCEHLLVDGQKMSKSLGNFYTIPDVVARGYTAQEVRYALLRVHYRKQLNFTWDGMNDSREALNRINDWLMRLRDMASPTEFVETQLTVFADQFFEALDNDLDISIALGRLSELIGQSNRAMDDNALDPGSAQRILSRWSEINGVLQIQRSEEIHRIDIEPPPELKGKVGSTLVITSDEGLPPDIAALSKERADARLAKDWKKSDELRDKIIALGWDVRDSKGGQKIVRRPGA